MPKRANCTQGYQLIMYDMDYKHLKSHPRKPRTGDDEVDELILCMNEWREEVEMVAYQKLGKKFIELWRGCKKPVLLLQKDYDLEPRIYDSVSHTAAWIWDTINGHFPSKEAFLAELEDEWELVLQGTYDVDSADEENFSSTAEGSERGAKDDYESGQEYDDDDEDSLTLTESHESDEDYVDESEESEESEELED
ncbi:uncharacterized protein JN550_008545 [Neoarthrinium moseri]|uniref:uncharacterized protein n=1 Tax=Neoarthrinium moseri TaxID=1658444 RepID=UPI001FDC32E2|nr:uncharacterized protein JN550_008545 [Neoarthrinium moseri]KAI1864999.1 hypothetical protein JN550_008545 [Neoarthrinium moseri]